MVGRQSFFPTLADLTDAFGTLGVATEPVAFLRENPYGEKFFRLLGAKTVESVDASDYEHPTHTHDLNRPIPPSLEGQYSCVYDGGTLEHIFDCPRAFQNCMRMVRPGGHFVQVNCCNNYAGHGFWQFSPELLFRIFTPINGFRVGCVLIHEMQPDGRWFAVTDPAIVRDRVTLVNSSPTYILTIARRESISQIFDPPPQQSDYVATWAGAGLSTNPSPPAPLPPPPLTIKRFIPNAAKRFIKRVIGRVDGPYYNPTHFRKLSPSDVLHGRFGGS
jgi:hypothetical protein